MVDFAEGRVEMECNKCTRTDIKCCVSCGRDQWKCDVLHECGKDCPEYTKQTNADRIRSMTDEELAEFLESYSVCENCEYLHGERCSLENPCVHGFANAMAHKWLRKEVEE